MTDGEGKFAFRDLDPTLYFQLLVLAPDHAPLITELDVDPLKKLARFELVSRDLDNEPPERVVRGVVRDAAGRAVARARIEPVARKLERGVRYGAIDADPLAVSATDGTFEFAVFEPGMVVQAEVQARGFAKCASDWLTAGAEDNVIVLRIGVTLTGRVERDGQPVAGYALGLTLENQRAGANLGATSMASDATGRFTFINVPAEEPHLLYGGLSNLGKGALALRAVTTGADDTTLDLGVLTLERGATLTGRVVVSDGSVLPEGAGLLLSRDAVDDTVILPLAAGGAFRADSLPGDVLTLGVRLRTHHVSKTNASYDFVNHQGLIGSVREDLELELVLDPGPQPREDPEFDKELWKRYEELRSSPLRGRPAVEASAPR